LSAGDYWTKFIPFLAKLALSWKLRLILPFEANGTKVFVVVWGKLIFNV